MSGSSRKDNPLFSGVLMYFPDALLAISHHSKKGNDKHNPGQPLHWAKEKSKDQADCIARHLIDIGPNWDAIDPETGSYHAAALAWRALALLQTLLERDKKEIKVEDPDRPFTYLPICSDHPKGYTLLTFYPDNPSLVTRSICGVCNKELHVCT